MKPGDRYGRLTVLATYVGANGRRMARVKCDCGKSKNVQRSNLFSGHTQSCGCYRREQTSRAVRKHGHAWPQPSPTYQAWQSMITNCTLRSSGGWRNYGGLGVRVCQRWLGPHGFEHFLADLGERPSAEHRLTRRNKGLHFTPANTYWATRRETDRNTRRNTMYRVGDREQCLVDWAAEYGIPKATLHYRVVTKGMSMRDALDVGRGKSGKVLPKTGGSQ
jgi:hypothetical protein